VAIEAEARRFAAGLSRLMPRGGPVLLAVSGGPDSMAMLSLAAAAGVRASVATVDHRLRAGSADEAAQVAGWCATVGLSHATLVPDQPPAGASLQARAREVRYRLLADHARSVGAVAIATAHHVDDQAETFLMRAARGSGVAGLAGVRAAVAIEGVEVVRPLLDWRRAELRAVVRRAGAPFVDDPANHDPAHDRTRFRQLLNGHEWLDPPGLARAAAAVAEADADLRAIAEWLWRERAEIAGTEVTLRAADLPRTLARRLVARAVTSVRTAAGIERPEWTEASAIEPLLDALIARRQATQAGVLAVSRNGHWRFRPAPVRRSGG
jgi:tRNA(Ile)-lysidine synthase